VTLYTKHAVFMSVI